MEGVANTVIDVYLPLSTVITSDNFIRVDGKTIDVREVSRVSNLLWIRGVRIGTDQVATSDPKYYACELEIDWDDIAPDLVVTVPDESFREYNSVSACHSYVMPISISEVASGFQAHTGLGFDVPYPVDYTGVKMQLAIYNAAHELVVQSLTGSITWDDVDTADNLYYLTAVPQIHSDPAAVTLTVKAIPLP